MQSDDGGVGTPELTSPRLQTAARPVGYPVSASRPGAPDRAGGIGQGPGPVAFRL